MARPLCLEFAGVITLSLPAATAARRFIFRMTRQYFTELLRLACDRFNWVVHAWCLMGNHYHLVVETPDGNLARGMRQSGESFAVRVITGVQARRPLAGSLTEYARRWPDR